MGKTSIFVIAAVVVVLLAAGGWFFFAQEKNTMPFSFAVSFVPPDAFYNYVPTLSNFTAGQPLNLTITAIEKPNLPLSSCHPANFNFGTCSSSAYGGQPWCQSESIINTRSIRGTIDGINVFNTYYYPDAQQAIGYSLSPSLTKVGEVCCWGFSGACSTCSDQDHSGRAHQRAYIYTSGNLGASQSINGTTVFSMSIIPPALAPGTHTLCMDYLAETMSSGSPRCGYAQPIRSSFSVSGVYDNGDQNFKTNTHHCITFIVPDTTSTVFINNTLYIQNTTQVASLQSQLDGVNAQLASSQNLSASQIADLQGQKFQLEARITALVEANAVLAAEKARLQAQVESLSAILASTQANLTALEGTVAILQQVIQTTNNSLNTAQASITLMQGQITELRATYVQTQAELETTKAQLAAVTIQYNEASAKLRDAYNAQESTQIQLKTTLDDLKSARDANMGYRATLDQYGIELQATQQLSSQQDAEITRLRGVALTKEQIANASLMLAAQKNSEAETALAEVRVMMAQREIRDVAFNVAMQELQANLSKTSVSLGEKITMLDGFSVRLQEAQTQSQAASTQLAAANSALLESKVAFAQSQADVAALQKANTDLKAQLAEEKAIIPIPQQTKDWFAENWIVVLFICIAVVLAGAYLVWGRK